MPEPIAINVTPAAFHPGNPKAQENIAKFHEADEKLKEVQTRKADLLDRIIRDLNLGRRTLSEVLVQIHMDPADAAEIEEEWDEVNAEHATYSERLMEAVAGK